MATLNSGKKLAAGVTAVVALGSFSVAGISALAVGAATTSHTVTSSTSQDDGTEQDQGRSLDNGYDNDDDDGNDNSSGYSNGNSGGIPIQPGNGGAISGKSAGS